MELSGEDGEEGKGGLPVGGTRRDVSEGGRRRLWHGDHVEVRVDVAPDTVVAPDLLDRLKGRGARQSKQLNSVVNLRRCQADKSLSLE